MGLLRRTITAVMSFRLWLLCLAVLGLLMVASTVADADHLPDNRVARGKADSILCGIDVKNSSVAALSKLLGKPTVVRSDTRIWKTANVKVEVGIDQALNGDNSPGALYISYVEVWGTKPDGKLGRTGKGLALGDTIDRLREVYGTRYIEKLANGVHTVSIEWRDTTGLQVEFDKNGRVNHMRLLAPE